MDVLEAAVAECNLKLFASPSAPLSPIQEETYHSTHDTHSHKMEALTVNAFNLRACFDDTWYSTESRPGCLVLGVRFDDNFYEQFEAYYKLNGIKKLPVFKLLSRLQVFQVQRGYVCMHIVAPTESFKPFDAMGEDEIIILPVTALSVLLQFFKTVWPKLVQCSVDKNSAILPTNNQKTFVTKTFAVRTQFGLCKKQIVVLFQFKKHIKMTLYADPLSQTATIETTCNNEKKKIASWSLSIPAMEQLTANSKTYDDFLLAYKQNKTSADGASVAEEPRLESGSSGPRAEAPPPPSNRGYMTAHEQTVEKLKDMSSSLSGNKRSASSHSHYSSSKRNK